MNCYCEIWISDDTSGLDKQSQEYGINHSIEGRTIQSAMNKARDYAKSQMKTWKAEGFHTVKLYAIDPDALAGTELLEYL